MHGPKLNTVHLTDQETAAIVQALAEIECNGIMGAHNYLMTETCEPANDRWFTSLMIKVSNLIECPNHKGAFDCSPFCEVCEGNQEYNPAETKRK